MPKQTFKSDLKMGEKYRDETTGIEGHLVAVYFFEHACERGCLRYVDNQNQVQEVTFDAPELVHVVSGKTAQSDRPGGPDRGSGSRSIPRR